MKEGFFLGSVGGKNVLKYNKQECYLFILSSRVNWECNFSTVLVLILTRSDQKQRTGFAYWVSPIIIKQKKRKGLNISVFSGSTSQDACTCKPFKSCNWSQHLIEKIAELPQRSQSWNKRFSFFRDRICEYKTRNVFCCSGKAPNENFLEILKTPNTEVSPPTTATTSKVPTPTIRESTTTRITDLVSYHCGRSCFNLF